MRSLWMMMGVVVVAACGGEAIIDPPLGSGGSGSSSNSNASSSTGVGITVTTTGMGMLTCEELAQRYRDLIQEAKRCNSDLTVPQCGDVIPDDLYCPCSTSFEITNTQVLTELSDVVSQFTEQGCLDEPVACPPFECVDVAGGECLNDSCSDVVNN